MPFLDEPELHFGDDVLVPDIAGWRRERVPADIKQQTFITPAPDWACEVLSPSTQQLDRGAKRDIYAREGVSYLWFVDAIARSLEVMRLEAASYQLLATCHEDARVRAEPFESLELDLSLLWNR